MVKYDNVIKKDKHLTVDKHSNESCHNFSI